MDLVTSKDSEYDSVVDCKLHNGEWSSCNACEGLKCPVYIDDDDAQRWVIPEKCPLREGPVTVTLKV